MDKKVFVIAIDGPVASGKGTISTKLARELKGFYLSSGAMYRAFGLHCLENKIDITAEEAIVKALIGVEIELTDKAVLLNGTDVTERTKDQDVSNTASIIAMFPKVRERLLVKQHQIATNALNNGKIVVAEGRDTGTKVFPDAPIKIYLTADKDTRAARRLAQYQDSGQITTTLDEVMEEITERDRRDTERVADPLPKNPVELGYFILDSSNMTEERTLEAIMEELKRRELINK